MSNLAVSLNMSSFKALAQRFTPNRAVMLRGKPGIGKSQSVWQLASELRSEVYKNVEVCRSLVEDACGEAAIVRAIRKFWKKNENNPKYDGYDRNIWHYDMGIPVIERRLSQIQEGDIVGLPFRGKYGTMFAPTEWLLLSARYPSILFLDELNRAPKAVEQATFQIADSKAFYGHMLHDETRVYVAVNIGDAFDVEAMDPAAISRYAVIDLSPTVEDWLKWAQQECDPYLVDFIRRNNKFLDWEHENYEPNRKVHDRRAWGNLDSELRNTGLYNDVQNVMFFHMCAAMVGPAAANAFWSFCKEQCFEVSAEECLADWESVKKRLGTPGTDRYLTKMTEISGKIDDYLAKHEMTPEQLVECGKLMHDVPAEHLVAIWKSCAVVKNNIKNIHPYIQDLILKMATTKPIAKTTPENK
jgi:hypothetical protein